MLHNAGLFFYSLLQNNKKKFMDFEKNVCKFTRVIIRGVSRSLPPTRRIPQGVLSPSRFSTTANSCSLGLMMNSTEEFQTQKIQFIIKIQKYRFRKMKIVWRVYCDFEN